MAVFSDFFYLYNIYYTTQFSISALNRLIPIHYVGHIHTKEMEA
jgi:hypothetical protein